ncbi:CHASE domain-containing protein [Massilia endophytica]|uniref:CHASE domain-containing protein n=1 Tax=Massilia endophytica TaxID=2899220 RepID=UPI001E5811CF|nr:CHASE domain-containing protein [Massilia endophytica]UGQ46877.1 CHASE domain-containing protein [Massilia endophytica]
MKIRPIRLQDLLSPPWLSGLVFALCLCATATVWHSARSDARRDAAADFDFRVRELVNNIALRMQAYQQVLYGAQGLFASSDYVDRQEFHTYLAGQQLNEHFPGIQGVGYMLLVPHDRMAEHVASLRREGFKDYRPYPPGEGAFHTPIVYLEPFSGTNLKAFGYDPWQDPVRRAALEQARDSALPAMTGRIRLVQETEAKGQAGFLIVLPVYRNGMPLDTLARRRAAIMGWVYSPFRIGDVMAGIGGGKAADLDIEIYDGDGLDSTRRMYDSQPAPLPPRALRTVQKLRIAGHQWTLQIGAAKTRPPLFADKPRLLALTGLAFSLLLASLAWVLAASRRKAREALCQSREMAEALKEGQQSLLVMAESAQNSQAVLRGILDSTIDGIVVDNFRGSVLNSNRRFRQLWDVPEQLDWQADGRTLMKHIEQQLEVAEPFVQAGKRPFSEGDEHKHQLHLKDGRTIELYLRMLRLANEPARLWSFRDVTESTLAVQRERTRSRVLELLASGAPLPAILDSVVLGVEEGNPGALCSILLLDEEKRRVLVGAAPNLPAFFNKAIDGAALQQGVGSCVQAMMENRRVIVEDIRHDSLWSTHRELALRAGLLSCWSDPIRSANGKVLGAFAIYFREPRHSSVANIALAEQAAHLAGIAIEQAQAAQALRSGEARFRSLYDNAPVALWQQDWSAVRAALQDIAASGVEDLAGWLQANPSQLKRLAGLVRITDVNAAALTQVGGAAGGKDLAALSLAQNFADSDMSCFGSALVALARGAQLFACESSFLRLDGVQRENELTLLVMPGHAHTLDFVIVSTVDITERKRLNEELQLLATTDSLTGLPNRREFMRRLEEQQGRLLRGLDGQAAVLMLDIDHFKNVNDQHGHAVGDAVIRHLASLMKESQRKVDMLGRVGGEEFAALLPGADPEAARVFAERLRQRIEATPLRQEGLTLSVTVSVGIAAMDPGDEKAEAVLARADEALYCAKRGGRNRVEQAGACS